MTPRNDRLEDTLRAALRDEAPARAPDELFDRIRSDVNRTPQRRTWRWLVVGNAMPKLVAAGGAALSFVVALMAIAILLKTPSHEPAVEPPVASADPTSTPAATESPGLAAATPYPVTALIPGATNFPVLAAGSVWAPRIGRGDVVRFDPATNQITARIPVSEPLAERGPHAITAEGDDIWVNADDAQGWAVLRIDPQTNQVAERISVGVPGWAMAIVGDTIWMTSFERSRVVRIDVESGEVVAEIRLPDPLGVAATDDGVWVALGGRGTVARIDPATNEYRLIETGTETTTIPAVIGEEVWVTTLYSQEIVIISALTEEVIDTVEAQGPMGIITHDGLAWVSDSFMDEDGTRLEPRVIAIDLPTRNIVRELPMPGLEIDRGIAVDDESVWVVTPDGVARLPLDP